jgi:hypothetical protein
MTRSLTAMCHVRDNAGTIRNRASRKGEVWRRLMLEVRRLEARGAGDAEAAALEAKVETHGRDIARNGQRDEGVM